MDDEEQFPKTKWVNVDFSNTTVDESYGGVAAPPPAPEEKKATIAMNTETTEISVSEPVKQGEGMNAYISYKITTLTKRSGFKDIIHSVIRRYSDFVWLHGSLTTEFPGLIIPPLPEKLLVGRFSPEFIESRRRALEKFLNRTQNHAELNSSASFKAFLEISDTSDDALAAIKKALKETTPLVEAPKRRHSLDRGGILQWIDETVQQISTTLGNGIALEKTSADVEFEQIETYIDGLEPIMLELQKHAHGLTKRSRDMADGLFDFGVSFTLLGQSEADGLNSGLGQVGQCADKLSVLAAEQAEKEVLYFEEPIIDYIRLIQAVKVALQKRSDAKLAYQTALGDFESKKAVREKLEKQNTSHEKAEKLEKAVGDEKYSQERAHFAKEEYDLVTDRVLREVERFKAEKLQDFKSIILDYIYLQIEYNQKIEEEWKRIIPRLQEIQITEEQH